jgi:hypothetical protein
MADLNEAYNSLRSYNTKKQLKQYILRCVHCNSANVIPLINDGGSIQSCQTCGQTYHAKYTQHRQ